MIRSAALKFSQKKLFPIIGRCKTTRQTPPIKTLPKFRPPPTEAQVWNNPKVYDLPDAPQKENSLEESQRTSKTWLHNDNNDEGTLTWAVENFHWITEGAYDLEALKEFARFVIGLDKGQLPIIAIFRSATQMEHYCPGADLVSIYEKGPSYALEFYKTQQETVYLMATMKKMSMVCLSGNTMGLGAGLSYFGTFRVLLGECSWSMPNILYGAIPDCGSTYILPRLDGEFGMYYALTGKRVDTTDCTRIGLTTHFMIPETLEQFERDTSLMYRQTFEEMFDAFGTSGISSGPSTESATAKIREKVIRIFGKPSLFEIFEALKNEPGEWAKNTLNRLEKCSPIMLHVTFRLQKIGRHLRTLEEALYLEFRIIQHMMKCSDYWEGIKARMIDNRNPLWEHNDIYSVKDEEIAKFFEESNDLISLNLVPCGTSGFDPTKDPFEILDKQLTYLMKRKGLLGIMESLIDSYVPPEEQNYTTIKEAYVSLLRQTGIEYEGAKFDHDSEKEVRLNVQKLDDEDKKEVDLQIKLMRGEVQDKKYFIYDDDFTKDVPQPVELNETGEAEVQEGDNSGNVYRGYYEEFENEEGIEDEVDETARTNLNIR